MMKINLLSVLKCIFLLATIVGLSGCVNHVRTTVSTYRSDTALPPDATFFITHQAETPPDFDSLEFAFFAERFAAQLNSRGFKAAPEESASHRLILQYDNTRQKRDSDSSRVHFHTSLGYVYRYGSIVVVDGNDYDRFEFVRRVKASIETNSGEPEKIVSLAAVSAGRCEHLASVFDPMVTAILDNLYSKNGSIIPVKVKSDRSCSGTR